MATISRAELLKARNFLSTLDVLLRNLPTAAERKRLEENLAAVTDFLEMLRATLSRVPSAESVDQIRAAVRNIGEALERAGTNPLVAGVFQGPRGLRNRMKPKPIGDTDLAQARSHVEKLENLPIDEMRATLNDDRAHSIDRLRVLARVLGIRNVAKLGRDALVHQVSARIANYRGYRRLGASETSASSS
jgi:hypothetical protein